MTASLPNTPSCYQQHYHLDGHASSPDFLFLQLFPLDLQDHTYYSINNMHNYHFYIIDKLENSRYHTVISLRQLNLFLVLLMLLVTT